MKKFYGLVLSLIMIYSSLARTIHIPYKKLVNKTTADDILDDIASYVLDIKDYVAEGSSWKQFQAHLTSYEYRLERIQESVADRQKFIQVFDYIKKQLRYLRFKRTYEDHYLICMAAYFKKTNFKQKTDFLILKDCLNDLKKMDKSKISNMRRYNFVQKEVCKRTKRLQKKN